MPLKHNNLCSCEWQLSNPCRQMSMKTKSILGVVALVAVVGLLVFTHKPSTSEEIKIGVVTPLTGGVAYWGESSRAGIRLAEAEFKERGLNVSIILEDGQLDPKTALSAAQKLVNVDHVDAMYSEFNPAAIAVSSFLKDKEIIQIYDATPVSPLALSENFFKTYLNYQVSCREVAEVLKSRGYKKVGVLKMNLEHGDLCAKGITEVYGGDVAIESYNPGVPDFRTLLSKLDAAGADVIFHASFQPETIASLKHMRSLGLAQPFTGLAETMTPDVTVEYADVLDDAMVFGLPPVDQALVARIEAVSGTTVADRNAAALAYLHITQLAETLHACDKEIACVRQKLSRAEPDSAMGFKGFKDRIAGFDTLIQEWKNGTFVPISS